MPRVLVPHCHTHSENGRGNVAGTCAWQKIGIMIYFSFLIPSSHWKTQQTAPSHTFPNLLPHRQVLFKPQLSQWSSADTPAACSVLDLPNAVTFQCSSSWCADPNHKVISLLLHNLNFATVMNHNVNISGNRFAKGVMTHRMRTTGLNKEKVSCFQCDSNITAWAIQ